METDAKVAEMKSAPCAKILNMEHDEYIALVDIVYDFATADVREIKNVYEETKNNVMRRFDVTEDMANAFINMVCYGIAIDALTEISAATPPKQVASFTPDVAILNMTRSAGAMSVIRNAAEEATTDKKDEYMAAIQKLADDAGFPVNIAETAAKQVPQLIVLLALYPAFALGIVDEEFFLSKLREYTVANEVSPLVTRNSLQTIFVIAAANEKAFSDKDED